MKSKHRIRPLCCPEFVPPGEPDDFCIDEECCPEKIPTPKFPSPTTCLPEEVQRELEERIDEVNDLLLDLALSSEQPEEARRKAFDGLFGQFVKVKLTCPEEVNIQTNRVSRKKRIRKKQQKRQEKNTLNGCVRLVGWDFIQLQNEENNLIIPSGNICLIKPEEHFLKPFKEPRLNVIDPCFRRALTFNFGETVASSPKLIQIFYRLRLTNFLLLLIDEQITLVTVDKKIVGTVINVSKESITICHVDGKRQEIPINTVCFLLIKHLDEFC